MIVLSSGIISVQAQSNRRVTTPDRNERTTATRTETNKSTPQRVHTTQPVKQVQKSEVQRQPVRQGQNASQRTVQQSRQVQKPQVEERRTADQTRRPVSISTKDNPRSTYRKADNTVYVDHGKNSYSRANKYSNERYFGGKYYHYAYPTRHANFHYHHDTYLHHYNVLYYPVNRDIFWTRSMYRDYNVWYPEYRWHYNYGYRIQSISVFEARFNLGEVAMVYGRVYATWHNEETDDYLLFFGGDYPQQQFTVVLPGNVARRFSWRPERYFLGEHITVTGLITTFDGIPEIVVKNKRQLGLY